MQSFDRGNNQKEVTDQNFDKKRNLRAQHHPSNNPGDKITTNNPNMGNSIQTMGEGNGEDQMTGFSLERREEEKPWSHDGGHNHQLSVSDQACDDEEETKDSNQNGRMTTASDDEKWTRDGGHNHPPPSETCCNKRIKNDDELLFRIVFHHKERMVEKEETIH